MNKTIYYVILSELQKGNRVNEQEAEKIIEDAASKGFKIIHIESEEYPNLLRFIHNPPWILYCLGDIALLNKKCVAVVGTRRPSPYGKWAASKISEAVVRHGSVHVSGMAAGIDSAGHRAVLDCGGKSIAVLGTGIDIIYPKSSADIYDQLKTKGLIISEYKPGTSGSRKSFPERNRIISGISTKCVIVEGARRSGSLITSRLALEQGRDVYALPGNINNPNSYVPNQLIADGAVPLVCADEFENTLFNVF